MLFYWWIILLHAVSKNWLLRLTLLRMHGLHQQYEVATNHAESAGENKHGENKFRSIGVEAV